MHQRASTDVGASPDLPASSSVPPFSDSKTGAEGAGDTISDVPGAVTGGNHHGGAKFPLESGASDGGA